jgi:hypothetical protein
MSRDPNLFPDAGASNRRRLRSLCLVLIAALFLVSVPWYRESDAPLALWWGLPDWVAVALICYVGVAVLNGVAWLNTEIPDVSPDKTPNDIGEGSR